MKKFIRYKVMAAALIICGAVFAQEGVVDSTVLPFFSAMRAGDVVTVKSFIGGDLYDKMRPLLDENPDYPQLLRDTYKEIEVVVDDVVSGPDATSVNIELRQPGVPTRNYTLMLNRDNSGVWKIIDQKNRI